jgi:hypothetical protein
MRELAQFQKRYVIASVAATTVFYVMSLQPQTIMVASAVFDCNSLAISRCNG